MDLTKQQERPSTYCLMLAAAVRADVRGKRVHAAEPPHARQPRPASGQPAWAVLPWARPHEDLICTLSPGPPRQQLTASRWPVPGTRVPALQQLAPPSACVNVLAAHEWQQAGDGLAVPGRSRIPAGCNSPARDLP